MIKKIKEKVSCVSYAIHLGWNIHESGDRTFSLDKGSNDTCLVIYDEWWYDFKLGKGGDVIDLCAIVNHGGDKGEAILELCSYAGISRDSKYEDYVLYMDNLEVYVNNCHQALGDEDRNYLLSRRINGDTVDRLKLGRELDGRISIPYWKNGRPVYVASRGSNPKYLKMKIDDYCENIPWGLHTLERNKQLLVISEGAFDAISFEQEGYSVLSPIGGHFPKYQMKQIIDICKGFNEVFICFDSDNAGQGFTMKMAKVLLENKIHFSAFQLVGFKDVNEYYVANGHLDFIKERVDGLLFVCSKLTDKDDFEDFIRSLSRFIPRTKVADIFRIVNTPSEVVIDDALGNKAIKKVYPFDKEWLSILKKDVLSPPSEYFIVDQVVKKFNLRYLPQLGFYEYKNGYWNRDDDVVIKNLIAKEYGLYSNGSRVNGALNLLKARVSCKKMFNTQPVFNFRNGVLMIESGELHAHSEIFDSTIQLSYDYDELANCPNWEAFLIDVTGNNYQKMQLIQEMFGYVLFNDCRLQRAFMLIGLGADGKSQLLEVMHELFGRANTSTIPLSGLAEPFQRIGLLTSLVNICSDISTETNGAEDMFKQIVTGDQISACYKGADFINFKPRSKMVFSANNLIHTQDMSRGMDRRILFIKFPYHYCENPIRSMDKQADIHILDKLLPELSGIFNWAYKGYKRLKEASRFTQTDEQEAIKSDFREMNNPIYVFINEVTFESGFTPTRAMYDKYKMWCADSGRKMKSFTSFSRDLKNTVEVYFSNLWKYENSGTTRGYSKELIV